MVMPTFTWGSGGVPVTPEQAKRQRAVAEALIGRTQTPAKNWAEGLSHLAGAYTGTVLQDRAAEAELAGAEEVGGLFSGLSSSSPEADIIAALSNPWASEGQQSVAQALLGQQFAQNDPYRQLQMEKLQQEIDGGGAVDETWFAPEWGSVGDQPVLIQTSNRGNVRQPTGVPDGFAPRQRLDKIDRGNDFLITDTVTGQQWVEPKDNYTPAYDAAAGGAEGKNDASVKAELESIDSKMPGLRSVVGQLKELSKTATYTMTGQLIDNVMRETGQEPTENAIARAQYISMVDNQILPLLRDTFGAQFTQKEGESLKATLGNPDLSPIEKQAVLESFIQQKERDVAALRTRVNGEQGAGTTIDMNGTTVTIRKKQ